MVAPGHGIGGWNGRAFEPTCQSLKNFDARTAQLGITQADYGSGPCTYADMEPVSLACLFHNFRNKRCQTKEDAFWRRRKVRPAAPSPNSSSAHILGSGIAEVLATLPGGEALNVDTASTGLIVG